LNRAAIRDCDIDCAQSIRGRMALNGLFIPEHALWCPALLRELLAFPAGKHDDQVDALRLIGQVLDRMSAGQMPPEQPPPMLGIHGLALEQLWEWQPTHNSDPRI
jgi:hypothetical protein